MSGTEGAREKKIEKIVKEEVDKSLKYTKGMF